MTSARAISAALALGERLMATAIRGEHDATWLGLTSLGDDGARLEPLGTDLYDGLPGVALFLGHLGAITGRAEATDLARRAIASVHHQLAAPGPSPRSLGGFTGAGGVIYSHAQLAALWHDAELVARAHALVDQVAALAAADTALDVIGGSAGAILALASLWHLDPGDGVRRAAIACGDRLLAAALPQPRGLAWPSPLRGGVPLAGMSHGAAGIAAALAEATRLTGDGRYADAAHRAISYERSRFVPEQGNWADLRFAAPEPRGAAPAACQTTWCNGAPGIGLARLRSRAVLADPEIDAEIAIAVATTVRQGFTGGHCLCHGGFGNLDFVLQAMTASGDDDGRAELGHALDRAGGALLDELERGGPRCATKLGIDTPGLMSGLSGIGLQLLRIARPAQVPSVLTLDPPPDTFAVA